MKLNLPILADELQAYGFSCQYSGYTNLALNFDKVRLLPKKNKDLLPGRAYIASAKEIEKRALALVGYDLIVTEPVNLGENDELEVSYLAMDEPCSAVRLLESSQDILDLYRSWEDAAMESIAQGRPLQETLDIVTSRLSNPVAIFDISSALIMSSGSLPTGNTGTVWDTVLSSGYAPVEEYDLPKEKQYLLQPSNSQLWRHATVMPNPKDPSVPVVAGITIGGVLFAIMAAVDICAPFTAAEISRFELARDLMQIAFAGSSEFCNAGGSKIRFLQMLASGSLTDSHIIAYHLAFYGWTMAGRVEAFTIAAPGGAALTENQTQVCLSRVGRIAPKAILFSREGTVVVLRKVHGDEQAMREQDEIAKLMEKMGLVAGLSQPMDSVTDVSTAVLQSRLTVEVAGQDFVGLVKFTDTWIRAAAHELREKNALAMFGHPLVGRLRRYDQESKTNYVECLKVILGCGLNLSQAAKLLFMHRNTLVYQKERIEQVMGCALSDINLQERMQMLLCCYILDTDDLG